ncbi:membrane protein insertase YidC [Stieleria varia]|uniref:Membrane protein insertase YidC n=1 Tax=Stieleria varia TaxID=2528005 RepID=A0A5C6B808_9BACT|nr:membrane protein insertase YidC [Stieleria varia]TWU07752.1 Membrane protein insertase YidC [Stieleria varia]
MLRWLQNTCKYAVLFADSAFGIRCRHPVSDDRFSSETPIPPLAYIGLIVDRRLFTFVLASFVFFAGYTFLRLKFLPPPNAKPAGQQAALDAPAADADDLTQAESADGGASDAKTTEDAGDSPGATETTTPAVGDPDSDQPDSDQPDSDQPDSDQPDAITGPAQRPQWTTLGSMDPASKHWMLVTISGQGGAIERLELTERDEDNKLKYRRVDVRYGYLGYLAPQQAIDVDGVLVNVVGKGTPAALAKAETGEVGLQAGDIIVSVGGKSVSRYEDIESVLQKTEPGQSLKIEVLRQASGNEEANEAGDDAGDDADNASANPTTLNFTAELTNHPLDLIRLAKYGGDDQIKGNDSRLSSLMTLAQVNRKSILGSEHWIAGLGDPERWIWSIENKTLPTGDAATAESIELSITLSDQRMERSGGKSVKLSRTFSLAPESYVVDLSVAVTNLDDAAQKIALRLEGVNGITLEGWWYSNKISPNWGGSAARDVVYKTDADGYELISGMTLLKHARKEAKDPDQGIFADEGSDSNTTLRFIGIDAQYFTVAYLPPEGSDAMTEFSRASAGIVANEKQIARHKERAVNLSFYLDTKVTELAKGETYRQDLRLFAGPKVPEVAAAHGLEDTVYYGWFWFVAKPLASLLHLLYAIVGNYGVAIILLTVLVRGAMFPLSRKAAINAQRMQELAPEMKKIAEKYKDDMEGRLKAQRELQQRVGFNPMAGCLPMFLQLPIFVGLYRALSVDIDLRQKPLFSFTQWASNLAGPDQMAYWGDWLMDYFSGRGNGWLGPYFNFLPVIVVALFLTQQKMFMPPATDEQTAMTQKVMTIMTTMMGLFFFRVPAGLCLYFIASSCWGICERIIVKKTLPEGKHFDPGVLEGTVTSKTTQNESKSSFADRMRQRLGHIEEAPAERPNKRKRPPVKKKR